MKSKKSSGKGKQAGKRGIKDLPVSDAKAKNAKGGGSVSRALDGIFKAATTAAQKVG
jgi:hypothetical protein